MGDIRLVIALRNGSRVERVEKVCVACSTLVSDTTMDEAADALQAAIAVLTGDE
ncbi:MAG: hypothetical protein AB1418_04145 [Pseudomonadota bacterium]